MPVKTRTDSIENIVRRLAEKIDAVFPKREDGRDMRLRCALLSALLSALAAYHLLVILGHGNADAIGEGLVNYTGADWALSCGRWAIRYMEQLSGNMIVPGLWIVLYALCCGLITVMLCRLWEIERKIAVCIIACLLTVNPTVIEQSLLQYMFMAWGLSSLLGVLFVYLCCTDGAWWRRFVLAPLCMAVAFGLYQTSVGLISVCFCMTLILRLLRGDTLRGLLRSVLAFVAAAGIGTALYFAALRVETLRWAVEESERVELFSLKGLFSALPVSLPQAYKTYAAYFYDHRFHRDDFSLLLFFAAALCCAAALLRLLKKRHIPEMLCAALLTALIPVLTNVADILFPYNTPVLIMQYQSMLIVPFLFALPIPLRLDKYPMKQLLWGGVSAAMICLLWGYLISANVTYRVYDLSYRHIHFVAASALNDVYELDDYAPDDVIAFAGFPDDDLLRMAIPAYRLAYGQYDSVAFWDGTIGLQNCRRNYLLNYFGIDAGYIYGHLYNNAVASEAFGEMPVWPEKGSVQRINGLVIVKFSDNPPVFG